MRKAIGLIIALAIVILGIGGYFMINHHDFNKESNENIIENNSDIEEESDNNSSEEEVETMRIAVRDESHTIVFALNESDAAKELYTQLPLTIEVENFSSNEKIFYPKNELSIEGTPLANSGGAGILAYYAPWGDVVMFYDSFHSASGLYELGNAIEGVDQISSLSGQITVEKIEN